MTWPELRAWTWQQPRKVVKVRVRGIRGPRTHKQKTWAKVAEVAMWILLWEAIKDAWKRLWA